MLYIYFCDIICICFYVHSVDIEFVFYSIFDSVCVYLKYNEISLTFTAGLCGVGRHMVVFGLSVRLSWYPMWMRWLLSL